MPGKLSLNSTWNLDPLPATDEPSLAYLLLGYRPGRCRRLCLNRRTRKQFKTHNPELKAKPESRAGYLRLDGGGKAAEPEKCGQVGN